MTIQTTFYLFALFILFPGCGQRTAGSAITPAQDKPASSPRNNLAGTYQGTMPCADCRGIKTTIILNNNETYIWLSHYLDKDNNLFAEKGKFKWNEDDNILTLFTRKKQKRLFRIGENQLFILEHNRERIRGKLSEHYTLEKITFQQITEVENLLENKRWVLAEISNDSTDQLDAANQRPFIEFDTQRKRISGFAGCNRFFGQYSIQKGNTIQFSEIGATKKYCVNGMKLEGIFFEFLKKSRYLKLNETLLIIENFDHKKIIVFNGFDH